MAKAKGKKAILPKRIAGVKVPKALRKPSGSLAQLLESPTGREVLAGALVAVAGSLVGSEKVRHVAAQGGHALAEGGRGLAHAGQGATRVGTDIVGGAVRGVAEAATGAVIEAARHVLPGGKDDGDREAGPQDADARNPTRPKAGGQGRREAAAAAVGDRSLPVPTRDA